MKDIIFHTTLLQVNGYHFSLFALVIMLTSLIIISVGVIVLLRERGTKESIFLFLIALTVCLWLLPHSFMYASSDAKLALLWSRLAYLGGVPYIPTALFQFTVFALRYPEQQKKAWLSWFLSFLFSIFALSSYSFIGGVKLYYWGYFPYYSWGGIPFLVFFFYILYSTYALYYRKIREALSPTEKIRTRLLFRAFLVASVAVIEFLPALGVNIPPLGFIPILSFVILGAPVIWRYHLVDITPAFAAEEIIKNISDALLVFDPDRIIRLVNPAFCKLIGKTENELNGLPLKYALPEFFFMEEEVFEEGLKGGKTFTLALQSGNMLFLETSVSPFKGANGEILAWITLIRDVTELKKAEANLLQSELHYRTIFENTGSATILIDEDMTISLVNREFEKLSGFAREEIEGKMQFPQFFISPDVEQMKEYHRMRRLHPGSAPKRYTTHLIDRYTKIREVLVSVDIIPQTKQSIASFTDLTELKEAQNQIAFQLQMLSRLYQTAQELSATLDLKTMALITCRHAVQDFGFKAAYFFIFQNEKREMLSYFPPDSSFLLQVWMNSAEKDKLLTALSENNSSLTLQFQKETCYPQLEEIAQKLEIKEANLFLLGKNPSAVGALICFSSQADILSSELADFVNSFVQYAGTAVERAFLFAELQKYIEMMRTLHNIDLTIASSLDAKTVLNLTLEEVIHQLKVDAVCVYLLDSSLVLRYEMGIGFFYADAATYQFRLGEGELGEVVLEKRPLFISDLEQEESPYFLPFLRKEGFLSLFAVPLVTKGEAQGVLIAFNRFTFRPPKEWLEFLTTLAGQLAIAIDNIGMFEKLSRSHIELTLAYDTTIEGWAKALELRDRETEGHTRRVTELTLKLAKAMGVKDKDLIHFRRGALLHDIGKMAIPDRILLKNGPLTEEEWEVMRKHPLYAWELLSPVEYLRPALDIPYCHHERWDGKGYPRGIKGEEIPLAARIFKVVDVWDALISDRPYRKAWPYDEAIAYIKEQAGSQFDPQVVEKFLELLPQILNETS